MNLSVQGKHLNVIEDIFKKENNNKLLIRELKRKIWILKFLEIIWLKIIFSNLSSKHFKKKIKVFISKSKIKHRVYSKSF